MKHSKPALVNKPNAETSDLLAKETLKSLIESRDQLNAEIEKLAKKLSPAASNMISKRRWDCR